MTSSDLSNESTAYAQSVGAYEGTEQSTEEPTEEPTEQERVEAREAALITQRFPNLDTHLFLTQTVSHKRGGPVERGTIVRFSKSDESRADVYFFAAQRVRRVKVKNLRPATALV